MSMSSPGSYSMVVSAAVDPSTKRKTTPFFIVPLSTIACTFSVMSRISPSFLVPTLTIWDSTVMIGLDSRQGDRKSTRLNSKSQSNLVCRLLLEKKKKKHTQQIVKLDQERRTSMVCA